MGTLDDDLATAKKALASSDELAKKIPVAQSAPAQGKRTKDIELPNLSGVVDPRIEAMGQHPTDLVTNVRLRNELLKQTSDHK